MGTCTCGASLDAADAFCRGCGQATSRNCPGCDAPSDSADRFCRSCGTSFGPAEAAHQTLWAEGEKRQLTVLFCDLVGSTAMGQRLDADAYTEIIEGYVATAGGAIEEVGGFVAQVQGDGIVAYFGYPEAHEDDTERAVQAGLLIQRRIREWAVNIDDALVKASARIGIHTGPVVLNEVGHGVRELLALGNTTNYAARVESVTPPGQVGVSPATRELLRGRLVGEPGGRHEVKGVEGGLDLFIVTGLAGRVDVVPRADLLHGREGEFELLMAAWHSTKNGIGRSIVVSGEAGIGKSSLISMVRANIDAPIILAGCSSTGSANAFDPILGLLHNGFGTKRDGDPAEAAAVWERRFESSAVKTEDALPYLLALAGLPSSTRYPLQVLSPELQRKRTIAAVVLAQTLFGESGPCAIVVEDLHWADPSTVEVLESMARATTGVATLLVMTARTEFRWAGVGSIVAVERLNPDAARTVVESQPGAELLGADLIDELVARADGVPLYLEELTASVVAGTKSAVPESLQDSLMARLDRSGHARALAQIASLIGRAFDRDLLGAIAARNSVELDRGLERLLSENIIVELGADRYMFRHVLLRDAAAESLVRRTRIRLSCDVVDVVEEQFSEVAAKEPARLARYCESADRATEAIRYLRMAAAQAEARSAPSEAASLLLRAIDLFDQLPDDERTSSAEIPLRAELMGPLAIQHGLLGAPEVANVKRLEHLEAACDNLDDRLAALATLTEYRSQVSHAGPLVETGGRLLALAAEHDLPHLQAKAHMLCGVGGSSVLHPDETMAHLEAVEALAERVELPGPRNNYDADTQVLAAATKAVNLALMGRIDEARERSAFALDRATNTLDHAFSRGSALTLAATVHFDLVQPDGVLQCALEGVELGARHGFGNFEAMNLVLYGWALTRTGSNGEAEVARGLDLLESATESSLPFQLALAADEALERGAIDEAKAYVAAATEHVEASKSHGFLTVLWPAMAHIEIAGGNLDAAVEHLSLSVKIARRVGHWGTSLRAASTWCSLDTAERSDEALAALREARTALVGGDDVPMVIAADAILANSLR